MRTACVLTIFVSAWLAQSASAEVVTKAITYTDKGVDLEGFVAYDTAKVKGPTPGVLIVHQWMGLTDYEKRRATQLAEMGYVAFALDIYGKNDRPKDRSEAPKYAGKYKTDRAAFRHRLEAGLAVLQSQPNVDQKRIAAIGYCFGGTGVLELARMGADVNGVVSFHGGLDATLPVEAKEKKPKVLVLHGADDPFVPADQIAAFMKEFTAAKFDWQMIFYSGAVHSFTHKEAGNDPSKGAAYEAKADARSWEDMQQFFRELFGEK